MLNRLLIDVVVGALAGIFIPLPFILLILWFVPD